MAGEGGGKITVGMEEVYKERRMEGKTYGGGRECWHRDLGCKKEGRKDLGTKRTREREKREEECATLII